MDTKPMDVRKELKRQKLIYDIRKIKSSWYVYRGDSYMWRESCLCTNSFSGKPASWWVDVIKFMAEQSKEK